MGIGTRANTALADASGLAADDDGVVVDEHLATTDPDIFAAGDVATAFYPHLGLHLRLGHWSPRASSRCGRGGMMEQAAAYDNVPYFFSDQYEMGMEYLGHVPRDVSAEVVVRGDLASGRYSVFWMGSERVLAGMNVNIWHLTGPSAHLVRSGARVDAAKLADPTVPLDEVFA